jgi:hypothetical protein
LNGDQSEERGHEGKSSEIGSVTHGFDFLSAGG